LCGTQRGCEKSKTFNFKGFAAWAAEGFFFPGEGAKVVKFNFAHLK